MRRNYSYIIVLITALLLMMIFSGCSKGNKDKSTFNLEDFETAMKNLGYDFEVEDVSRDFLPTTRKRMIVGDNAIDIYLFSSDKKMESEADNIDEGGSSYRKGNNIVHVSWVAHPHFYKKGSIIVQYVGEEDSIISTLRDIMGEQFAGFKR